MGGFYHEGDKDSSVNIMMTKQMDRGLAYGEASFETVRVLAGEVFEWQAHMRRLQTGLAAFGLHLSADQLEDIRQQSLLEANALGDDVLLRITVSGGAAEWGLMKRGGEPVVRIQSLSMKQQPSRPRTLQVLAWPFPPKSRPAKFTADYAETLRALHDKPDADVLFAYDDRLLGGATANVLLYRDGQWWSPDGPGVLPGVVRDFLVTAGKVCLGLCPVQWLQDAEAVVLSNSGSFLQAVASVDSGAPEKKMFDSGHEAIGSLADTLRGQPGVPKDLLR
ncbi:MAG: aminotransferase class IV [Mariprofundaceae bacterium]